MKVFSVPTYRVLRAFLNLWLRLLHPVAYIRGRENIPEGSVILCCNHSSFSDPIWVVVMAKLPQLPRIMAKKELLNIPLLGWLYRKLGAFPVDRDKADINAIKTAIKALRDGNKLLIFPEGTRIRRGKVSEAHEGAAMIALRTQTPLLPVYLSTEKHLFRPVELIFGEPYFPKCAEKKPSAEELKEISVDLLMRIYRLGESN